MARVVETVASAYTDAVRWETVVTKQLSGATRYAALSKKAGRPLPVPSIIVDGVLVFDAIPSVEELRAYIEARIRAALSGRHPLQ